MIISEFVVNRTCSPRIMLYLYSTHFLHCPNFNVIYWESSLSPEGENGREKQRNKEKTCSNCSEDNPLELQLSQLYPQEAITMINSQ